MKIKDTKREKNIVNYSIIADLKDLQKAFNKALEHLSRGITVKGFRPGKAPKYLIVANIGETKLQEETFSNVLEQTYSELIKEEKFDAIDYPKIDVKKFTIDFSNHEAVKGELEYEAKVELMPEAKLADFNKIKLSKNTEIIVSDKEVEDVINYLARQKAQFKTVAQPAKEGNRVEVNFEGSVDSVKLPEMKSKNHPIILGDKTMIPGFEEKLIGMKLGDKKEFDITFPSDYPKAELKGKKAHFEVEMLMVQEVIKPDFDDKMAADFGHKTLVELKDAIKHNVEDEKIHDQNHKEEEEIVEQLLKLVKVEIPNLLVERELDRMIEDAKQRVSQYKMPFEQYLASLKKTQSEFRESMTEQARKAVTIGFALREVIKELELKGEGQEVGQTAMTELLKIAYKNSGRKEYKVHKH